MSNFLPFLFMQQFVILGQIEEIINTVSIATGKSEKEIINFVSQRPIRYDELKEFLPMLLRGCKLEDFDSWHKNKQLFEIYLEKL